MNNVVLIGRGAIGAVYASALHDYLGGEKFRVALDAERLERYTSQEFLFNGRPYQFTYFTPGVNDAKVDLVIIATKWAGYRRALDLIEPLVGEDTVIMPLLNGLSAHREAVERFGASRVVRAFYLGNTASRDVGGDVTQDGRYRTNFGDDSNHAPFSHRVARVKALFDRAGIKYRIPENMVSAQWQKFVINIGTNQPSGLYRYNYGELLSDPAAMRMSENLMLEAQSLGVALGVDGAEGMVAAALDMFPKFGAADYSSMAQDVIAHRPTEIDIFAGEVIKMGRELSIPTPHNEEFVELFKAAIR